GRAAPCESVDRRDPRSPSAEMAGNVLARGRESGLPMAPPPGRRRRGVAGEPGPPAAPPGAEEGGGGGEGGDEEMELLEMPALPGGLVAERQGEEADREGEEAPLPGEELPRAA